MPEDVAIKVGEAGDWGKWADRKSNDATIVTLMGPQILETLAIGNKSTLKLFFTSLKRLHIRAWKPYTNHVKNYVYGMGAKNKYGTGISFLDFDAD